MHRGKALPYPMDDAATSMHKHKQGACAKEKELGSSVAAECGFSVAHIQTDKGSDGVVRHWWRAVAGPYDTALHSAEEDGGRKAANATVAPFLRPHEARASTPPRIRAKTEQMGEWSLVEQSPTATITVQ